MSEYCIIGKLKLVPIEGAKTLQLGYFGGLPYAVSISYSSDALYAIFLPDGQLSQEYYEANKKELGFFGKNLKVRSIKLMQGKIMSVGYVAPIESLAYTGYDLSKLKEGDSFNELNGVPVCRKYINPNTLKAQSAKTLSKKAKLQLIGLPEHPDTEQFYRWANTLEVGDLITITLKLDGTSCRVANVYEEVKQKWYHKLFGWFVPIAKYVNKTYTGTRRVIIQETTGAGFYGSHEMYLEIGRKLDGLLFPGEAVYGEIVGWQDENKPLFNRGGMKFIYKTKPGQRDFYVYNIKLTLPNGITIDLPWNMIKARCQQLGLKHVPEFKQEWSINYNKTFEDIDIKTEFCEAVELKTYPLVYDGDLDTFSGLVYSLVDGPDPIDPSHIREGVVLRVEKKNGTTQFFKAKSSQFYSLEDKSKEAGAIDVEEVQDESN